MIEVEEADSGGGDEVVPSRNITICTVRDLSLGVPDVTRVLGEPDLSFRIATSGGLHGSVVGLDLSSLQRVGNTDDDLIYTFEYVVSSSTDRIIAGVPVLSPPEHSGDVADIVESLLRDLGASPGDQVAVDPVKVGLVVANEITRR